MCQEKCLHSRRRWSLDPAPFAIPRPADRATSPVVAMSDPIVRESADTLGAAMTRTAAQVEAEIVAARAQAVRLSRHDPRRDDIDALVDSLVLERLAPQLNTDPTK